MNVDELHEEKVKIFNTVSTVFFCAAEVRLPLGSIRVFSESDLEILIC